MNFVISGGHVVTLSRVQTFRKFNLERDWEQFHTPKNLAMALWIEVAEFIGHFQWLNRTQSRSMKLSKKEEIKDKIGDILIYLTNFTDMLGIDPF